METNQVCRPSSVRDRGRAKRFFAYLADDEENWDYVEAVNDAIVTGFENRWAEDDQANRDLRHRIRHFWNKLGQRNQAWFVTRQLIKYEDILDIDPTGDSYARYPHVFLPTDDSERLEYSAILMASPYDRRTFDADPKNRIRFFQTTSPMLSRCRQNRDERSAIYAFFRLGRGVGTAVAAGAVARPLPATGSSRLVCRRSLARSRFGLGLVPAACPAPDCASARSSGR